MKKEAGYCSWLLSSMPMERKYNLIVSIFLQFLDICGEEEYNKGQGVVFSRSLSPDGDILYKATAYCNTRWLSLCFTF